MENRAKKQSIFQEFDPLNFRMFQVMDANGKIVNNKWKSEVTDKIALEAYKQMQFARVSISRNRGSLGGKRFCKYCSISGAMMSMAVRG